MAQTLPSNLYDPVLALEYMSYEWYENLSVLNKFLRPEPNAPIVFNANRAILQSGGQFIHAPTLNPLTTAESRRDLTSTSDATPVNITSRDDTGVRVCRKFGPVSITKSAEWLSGLVSGQLEQFFAIEASRRFQLSIRQYAIAAAKAAISNMTAAAHTKNVYSSSVRTNLSTGLLAATKALLGDRAEALDPGSGAGFIFRSEPYYTDLMQFQIGAGVRGIADVASNGGPALTLGLDYAVADDSSLTVTGSPYAEYDTLLLGPGALEVDLIRLEFTPEWMNPKAENIEFVLRADMDFEIRIPGFRWDTSGGGANPSLSTIATSGDWIVNYTDHREIAMALLRHNYSGN
jgi:hypothetical protein